MAFVWLALAVSLVAVVAATVLTTLRGIELFRTLRALGRAVGSELSSIERKAGLIERHLTAASRSGDALSVATGRLAISRARLNVLLSAFADARAAVGGLTGLVPRK